MLRHLIAVACLLEDHRFQGAQASAVVVHRLSCSGACAIFPDQGSIWCPPALHDGFPTTGPPGKAPQVFFASWLCDDIKQMYLFVSVWLFQSLSRGGLV